MRRFGFVLACVAVGSGAANRVLAEDLPPEAAKLVAAFEEDAEAIRAEAERKVGEEAKALAVKLKEIQDKYTKDAKLDEAVAIRDFIRSLGETGLKAEPDPGSLWRHNEQVGKHFLFKVTGAANGSLFGTDVYTTDSTLAVAAVHAGLLKVGETGVVRVTILTGAPAYVASTRNGVTSSAWSNYPASYKVSRALLAPEAKPKPDPLPLPAAVP